MLLGMLSSNGWRQIFSAASASSAGGIVLEAENCNPIFSPEWEQKNIRHGTGSEGHDSFSFVQAKQNLGQTVEFTLSVEVAGKYEVYVVKKDAYNRGIFDFSVDNEKIGTVDFYNPQSGVFVEHKIGNATLQAGDNILLATLIGRNSANTTLYGCAFDYFVFFQKKEKEPKRKPRSANSIRRKPFTTIKNNERAVLWTAPFSMRFYFPSLRHENCAGFGFFFGLFLLVMWS